MSATSVVALVPTAERGGRLGEPSEALVPVNGEPLVVHAVRGLLTAGCVRRVVVSAPDSCRDALRSALTGARVDARVVRGGGDRAESVRLALDAALAEAPDATIVLVHDVTRAFTPPELIRAVADEVARGAQAVVPVLPVADTVKRVDSDDVVTATVDRSALRSVQTPRGYTVDALRASPGCPVTTVAGHPAAMRIRTPFDLAVAEALFGGGQ